MRESALNGASTSLIWGMGVASSLFILLSTHSLFAQEALTGSAKVSGSAADLTPPNTIDEQHPERSIPSPEQALKNPLQMGYLLMDLISRAEASSQEGDHEAAIRYYHAIAKAVPERAISFSKLCQIYETVGNRKQALESCREALGKGGVTSEDYARYARLVLRQPEPLEPGQIQELDELISHLSSELGAGPNGKGLTAQLACELATRLEDSTRLSACTAQLAALAPTDARTLTFRWALALKEHDTEAAQAILLTAKQTGLPPAALAKMETQLSAERARPTAWVLALREWGVWGSLILAILVGFLLSMRRKQRLLIA